MGEERIPRMSPEDAIFDVRLRMVRIETVLKDVVKEVAKNVEEQNATRKKVSKLEIRFWMLIAFLVGSGILGGTAIARLIAS